MDINLAAKEGEEAQLLGAFINFFPDANAD